MLRSERVHRITTLQLSSYSNLECNIAKLIEITAYSFEELKLSINGWEITIKYSGSIKGMWIEIILY